MSLLTDLMQVMDHITAIETMAAQLNDLGAPVSELQVMTKITCTLPPSFRHFVSAWDNVAEADKTLDTLTARLLKEETLNERYGEEEGTKRDAAFFARNSGAKSSNPPRDGVPGPSRKGKRERPYCNYCKKFWHTIDVCRVRLRKENEREQQSDQAKKAKTSDQNDSESQSDLAFLSTSCLNARQAHEWYADSGATQHMTDQRWMLTNFTPIPPGTWMVNGIGNKRISALGQGDVLVDVMARGTKRSGTIHNVLYVPELGVNLISIASVTDKGLVVTFADTRVTISLDDEVQMEGQRVGRTLYRLNIIARHASDALQATAAFHEVPLQVWHQRLAHVNYPVILKMAAIGAVEGMNLKKGSSPPNGLCTGCALGKMHRLPFKTGREKAAQIGELVHTDVCGPMQHSTPKGARYYVSFKDDFSGFRAIYFLKNKSEVFDCFKLFHSRLCNETGQSVKTLRSDNGGEFMGTEFESWLAARGIRHETSVPHTPEQNGVAERDHRVMMESARSMIHAKNLPLELWAEAVNFAAYTLNRVLTSGRKLTPYECWYGKRPNVSHLRIFGTKAFTHIPDAERKKLDAKSRECILVGYSETQKGYRLWDTSSRKILVSRDVLFDEQLTPSLTDSESQQVDEASLNEVRGTTEEENLPQKTDQIPSRRISTRGLIPKKQWPAMPSIDYSYSEPSCYKEALESSESLQWKTAIEDELKSLMENETWVLTKLPPGRSVIRSRWTFKLKRGMDGIPPRYKARLVAKGYTQKHGIDYNETYAPVVKYDSLRAVLSIAAARDLVMFQLDVQTAFLNADLEEELYLEQPEGCVTPGRESDVCLLKKSIYGLKQSSRAWNKRFDHFLTKFGLERSEADPCIYSRQTSDDTIIVAIWVDDGLVCGNNETTIKGMIEYLSTAFKMTSGPAGHFVGLEIVRDRKSKTIYLCQPRYIDKIVHTFGMASCNPRTVPADPHSRLCKQMAPSDNAEKDAMSLVPYREAVGSLMYAATTFRPDIAYAVSQVAQFSENPGKAHWEAVKRIIAYLAGTPRHGLCFGGDGTDSGKLIGFTDSDYAGDTDTRKSTTGFVFIFNKGPVAWCSRRQPCTSLSTTEAEYIAASETSKESVWLRRMLNQLGEKQSDPTPIHCDNQSAIKLVRNPEFHNRTKHISVRFHFIRDQQEQKEIDIDYVRTEDQLADLFTKPLHGPRFERLRTAIGVVPTP